MKFFLPVRYGFRQARRHPKLVFLLYLVSLLPALFTAYLAWNDLAPELDHSLFADRALEGGRYAVWSDYMMAEGNAFGLVMTTLLALTALTFLVQVLASAGVVESLLQREHRREHPFLLGIGRHGWRFVRSAVWFLVGLAVLGALVGAAMGGVNELASEASNGLYQLWGWFAILLLGLLAFIPLDLAFGLSRIAAATHGDGRTFVGFFKALGHSLRHPLILWPLWLCFVVPVALLHWAYLAGRVAVQPGGVGGIVLVVLAHQVVFLLAAWFRVALWGGEIAYYQAAGEPRWCGKGLKKTAQLSRPVRERGSDSPDAARSPAGTAPGTAPARGTAPAPVAPEGPLEPTIDLDLHDDADEAGPQRRPDNQEGPTAL